MIDTKNFKADDILFTEPKKISVNGNEYQKIFFRNSLIFATDKILSSGVRFNKEQNMKVSSYSIPLRLNEELTQFMTSIIDKCTSHLRENYSEEIDRVNKYRMERVKFLEKQIERELTVDIPDEEHIKNCSALIDGAATSAQINICKCFDPYMNCLFAKINSYSRLFDVENRPINAKDIIDKKCYVKAAIEIESICIGDTSINLKVNVKEAYIKDYHSESDYRNELMFN